nr:MAG TPA: hypothetical protein [Caudoviricetes sp.]
MIKFENMRTDGWEAAVRGMRNSFNSWDKSDSIFRERTGFLMIGQKDRELMSKLAALGPSHAKFMRFITVSVDITAPLYFWKEFDTYKVGTVSNSCSTMHSIAVNEFTLDDFSHEHLNGHSEMVLEDLIKTMNAEREYYLKSKDKSAWCQMIQLLPSSYNQKRTILFNYEVLRNIYSQRKGHKLDEWNNFCNWIESLPCAADLIMVKRSK